MMHEESSYVPSPPPFDNSMSILHDGDHGNNNNNNINNINNNESNDSNEHFSNISLFDDNDDSSNEYDNNDNNEGMKMKMKMTACSSSSPCTKYHRIIVSHPRLLLKGVCVLFLWVLGFIGTLVLYEQSLSMMDHHHHYNSGDSFFANFNIGSFTPYSKFMRYLELYNPYSSVNNTYIPHIMWFTDKHNVLETKQPKHVYDNVINTITKYRDYWGEPNVPVHFLNDSKCRDAINETMPELIQYYDKEDGGPYKSDMCRTAVLKQHGGYYFDVDLQVVDDNVFQPVNTARFVTTLACGGGCFFQAFIASAPNHKLLGDTLFRMLRKYQHGRDRTLLGPITMATSYFRSHPFLRGDVQLLDELKLDEIDYDFEEDVVAVEDAVEEEEDYLGLAVSDGENNNSDTTTTTTATSASAAASAAAAASAVPFVHYPELQRQIGGPQCNYVIHDKDKKQVYFFARYVGYSALCMPFEQVQIEVDGDDEGREIDIEEGDSILAMTNNDNDNNDNDKEEEEDKTSITTYTNTNSTTLEKKNTTEEASTTTTTSKKKKKKRKKVIKSPASSSSSSSSTSTSTKTHDNNNNNNKNETANPPPSPNPPPKGTQTDVVDEIAKNINYARAGQNMLKTAP